MSGIDITEEVTQSQIEALAGGELLQAEARNFIATIIMNWWWEIVLRVYFPV